MSEQLRSIKRRVIVEKEKLKRELGTMALFSAAYGNVGSSIYYALGATTVFALGASPWALMAAGFFFMLTVWSFAEGTTMMPYAGGASYFSRKGINESVSFLTGWVDILAYVVTIAISSYTAVKYLAYFFPFLKEPVPIIIGTAQFATSPHVLTIILACAIVAALMLLNVSGVKEAAFFNIFFAVIDIFTQALMVMLGFMLVVNFGRIFSYASMGQDYWPSFENFVRGIAIAMVSYTGIDTISQMSEEARDHKKTIPGSYKWLIVVVLLMSVGLPLVAASVMDPKEMATRWLEDPIAGIAHYMPDITVFGATLKLSAIFGFWVAILAVTILVMATNAGIMGASRLAYSMGEHRQIPAFIFKLHRKFNTPHISIYFFSFIAALLLLMGLVFDGIFIKLASLYALSAMIIFTMAHVAVIAMRVKLPDFERPYKIKGNIKIKGFEIPVSALIGALFNIIIFFILAANDRWSGYVCLIWIAGGFAAYALYRKKHNLPVHEVVTIERVVEAAYMPVDYAEVLVPTTGSLDAEMIQAACKIALRDKSRVLALYVIEVPMTLPLEATMPAEREKGEKALDQAEMIGKEIGVKVDTRLVQARSAGKAIVEEAIKIRADLIMLGQPEKTALSEIFGAKTVSYVAQHAPCRVWIDIGQVQHNVE